MRPAALVLLLGGCDIVVGLKEVTRDASPIPGDEDGDGIADREDLCPHRLERETSDLDGDGIGDRCDPRPNTLDDRYFFAFDSGFGALASAGTISIDGDTARLGPTFSSLTLDLEADILDMEIGLTEIEVPAIATDPFAEIGMFAVNRAFMPDQLMRGDNCFLGANKTHPMYFEFNEDAQSLDALDARFPEPLDGKTGRLAFSYTPTQLECTFAVDGGMTYRGGGSHGPRTQRGNAAVTAEYLLARIDYLWIVTPRL